MARRVTAREARAHFAELTDRVRHTGEPVIVEKQGQPFVAVVSLDDFAVLERLRRENAVGEFTRLAGQAAREVGGPEPSEEEIVQVVRRTREALYRERYAAGWPPGRAIPPGPWLTSAWMPQEIEEEASSR